MVTIDRRVLSGHKAAVTSLDYNAQDLSLFASGSEDKTARLWDLRLPRATVKCITQPEIDDIEGVSFSTNSPNILYLATTQSILTFDLRNDQILIRSPKHTLNLTDGDEINAFSTSKSKTQHYLTLSHDSGDLSVYPIATTSDEPSTNVVNHIRPRKLFGGHTALVSSIVCRPKSDWEILTGGFDCNICLWDVNRGKPIKSRKFQNDISSPMQMVNPPYVYSLDIADDGKIAFVGLGNGEISAVQLPDLSDLGKAPAHQGMTTALNVVGKTVISGGIDRKVKFWKYELSKVKNNKTATITEMLSIDHGRKVNALICPSKVSDNTFVDTFLESSSRESCEPPSLSSVTLNDSPPVEGSGEEGIDTVTRTVNVATLRDMDWNSVAESVANQLPLVIVGDTGKDITVYYRPL